MEYRRNDPGAVQYGNFINYYQFNSAEERLKLLAENESVWLSESNQIGIDAATSEDYLVLDVGCNSGVFTELLWQHLTQCTGHNVYILGVDIDQALIERAKQETQQTSHITYTSLDVMDTAAMEQVKSFLHSHNRPKFDAVCCFSVTMWIHLNYHDGGLQEFLRKFADLAELLVVEPQPWKCYQTAERRLKKTGEVFPMFLELKWRTGVEQEIQNFLEVELKRCKVYECCPTKWKRRICFYR